MQTLDQNLTDLVRRNIISQPKRAAKPDSGQLPGLIHAISPDPVNAARFGRSLVSGVRP